VSVSFTYDAAGQRLSMSDGLGSTFWIYDDLGRITSVTDPFDGTVGYSYDLTGNRLSETLAVGSTTYTYNIANRLAGRVPD
jgi:YD repeat-containing protein